MIYDKFLLYRLQICATIYPHLIHVRQGRCGATNHLRMYWQKRFWIPIGVFFLGLLLLAATVKYTDSANEERVLALAKLNALTYANQMKDQLQQAVAITESLEHIIISEDGRLDRFEAIAKNQMNSYIHSIQLAPGGIVNQIYPSEGNDWAKLDLMTGGLSTKICQYGIDNDTVTFQGPTALSQGGQGIAVRNPVFLENSAGEKVFWGFTIALIRVPDIFRDTIDTLTNFGYYHRLSVATLPVSESYTPVNSSGVAFTESVSYTVELGNCCWKLEVAPIAGWNAGNAHNVVLIGGLVIVLLLTALVSSLLFLDQRRLQFRNLAATDALTGLLNRQGFSQAMEDYFRQHEASPCVAGVLDIDDFKLINDVYGHDAGDQVLKDIARNLVAAFPEDAIIGRNGGDEFSFLLPDTTVDAARDQIDRFVTQDRFYVHRGIAQAYSISLGYAGAPQGNTEMELLSKADMALYAVKLQGKHRAQAFQEDLPTARRTQLGFNLSDITTNSPTAFLICQADLNAKLYYASRSLVRTLGCSDFWDLTALCGGTFAGLLAPEDRASITEHVRSFLETAKPGAEDFRRLRCTKKDGSTIWLLSRVRVVANSNYGRLLYMGLIPEEVLIREFGMRFDS